MTKILLTGIPASGKTDLIDTTIALSERKIINVCLGDIVASEADKLWKTPKRGIPHLDFSHQQALRSFAIPEAALKAQKSEHAILDTPMSLFFQGTIPNVVYTQAQINKLHSESGGINYVVTLIDDPVDISPRFEGTVYPQKPNTILDWIAFEVDATRTVAPGYVERNGVMVPVRHLVIPKGESDESLVKLIEDPDPAVCYCGFPITHLKVKEDDSDELKQEKLSAQQRKDDFLQKLKSYCVTVVPMTMADSRVTDEKEIKNTVFRDLHWFVKNADYMVAFFPGDYHSSGVSEEMRQAARIGKPVILIHPSEKYDTEVFGFKPALHYRNEDEFFEAVENCFKPEFDKRPEVYLRKFVNKETNTPKFEHLY